MTQDTRNHRLSDSSRNLPLPLRVSVSLRAGVVLAIANIICVLILAWAYTHVRGDVKVISVTGSAKKAIRADLIVWRAKVFVNHADLAQGYQKLKGDTDRTLAYLKQQGVSDQEVKLSPISTKRNLARDEKGNSTEKVSSYDLYVTLEIRSADVDRISKVASSASTLLNEGILLEPEAPSYLYTRLADLKVVMLAEATKDATARAEQIASNSNSQLGAIREARMGVMQINPIHSNSVSDYGNNDTTSLDKEITAIVSAKFELE